MTDAPERRRDMSDNYKPAVEVVRKQPYANRTWIEDDRFWPGSERALLARGVPMVGDRVNKEDGPGVVLGHEVYVIVEDEKTGLRLSHPAHWLRPVIQNPEVNAQVHAEVEAVAKAVRDFFDSTEVPVSEIDRNIARAAIAALDRARGRDE